jgi:hypothetical protein
MAEKKKKPFDRKAYNKAYYLKNREAMLKRTGAYNKGKGKESHKKSSERWRKKNPVYYREYQTKRSRALHRELWGNKRKIADIYALAETMTAIFGRRYEVDHHYPLKGKLVCGLHVEANMKVISKASNLRKHNKMPSKSNGTLQLMALVRQCGNGRTKTCQDAARNPRRGAVAGRGRGAAGVLGTPRKPADAPVRGKKTARRNSDRA